MLNKQDDLDLHRTGAPRLGSLAFSDYRLRRLDETHALVTLRADVRGPRRGQAFTTALRFTRVWQRQDEAATRTLRRGAWQTIANHCSAVM